MLRLIATRFVLGVATLLAVSALIFICVQILPGDVASSILGQQATPDNLRTLRAELGLDQPAYVRYFSWLWGVLHGDFGRALTNKRDIMGDLWPRFLNTLFLASYSAAISVSHLGGSRHHVGHSREGRPSDRMANILSLIAISFPEFFVGYILMLIFSTETWLVFPYARDSISRHGDRRAVLCLNPARARAHAPSSWRI